MADKIIRIPGSPVHGLIRSDGNKLFVGIAIPSQMITAEQKFMSSCREVFDAALRSGVTYEISSKQLPGESAPPPKSIQ